MSKDTIKKLTDKVGGQVALAKIAGCSQAAVSKWVKGITRPGSKAVLRIESANLGVNRHDLRSDIYPNPSDGLPEKQETENQVKQEQI